MLDINMTFVTQMINFTVLLLVLHKFAWGPILGALRARTAKIENNLKQADADRLRAADMKKEYEAKLATARTKAQEIVDAASQRATDESKAQKETTRQEIEKMREAAKAQIQLEREEAAKEMRGQLVALSLTAAGKLLGHKMDEEADAQFIEDFIAGLSKEALGDLAC